MRTSASVNPAMLMAVGLIAVFYFALRLSDKRKTAERNSVLLCMGDGQGI